MTKGSGPAARAGGATGPGAGRRPTACRRAGARKAAESTEWVLEQVVHGPADDDVAVAPELAATPGPAFLPGRLRGSAEDGQGGVDLGDAAVPLGGDVVGAGVQEGDPRLGRPALGTQHLT